MPGGQKIEQQTDSVLSACGSFGQRTQRSRHDRLGSTASCTVHAENMEETSKHGVLGRHQPCSQERIEVLSDSIECNHSPRNTSSLLYPESCSVGNWRSHIREFLRHLGSLQRSPLKHDWMKELGSEVAQRPDGQDVQQFKSSQLNQPNPDPDHDRTEQPVVGGDPRTAPGGRKTSRSQEIETRYFHEEAVQHDRTGQPVVGRETSHEPGNEHSMLNEVNIDFRIPGLPHSVVKQADNYRVRELVKKIENHPHRHALQRDLQQNKAYNPFSEVQEDDSGHGQCRAI